MAVILSVLFLSMNACDSVKCTSPPSAVTAPTEKGLMTMEGAYRTSLMVYFFLAPLTDVTMWIFPLPRTGTRAPPIPLIQLELVSNDVKLLTSIVDQSYDWMRQSLERCRFWNDFLLRSMLQDR